MQNLLPSSEGTSSLAHAVEKALQTVLGSLLSVQEVETHDPQNYSPPLYPLCVREVDGHIERCLASRKDWKTARLASP